MSALKLPHTLNESQTIQDLVSQSREIVFLLDNKGTWLFLNPAWSNVTDYPIEETLGRSMNDFILQDDRETNLQKISSLVKDVNRSATYTVRLMLRDGSTKRMQIVAYGNTKDAVGQQTISGIMKEILSGPNVQSQAFEPSPDLVDCINDAPDIIYQIDNDGKFIFMNRTALQILGYTVEDIHQSSIDIVIHKDDREYVRKFYSEQVERHILQTYLEFRMVTRWGDWIWVGQKSGLIVHETQPVGLVSIARDITVQKKNEEELLTTQRQHTLALDSALHGIYFSDAKGIINYINPAAITLLGYSREEILGSTFLKFLDPSLKDVFAKQYYEIIASRKPSIGEYLLHTKSDQQIIVSTKMNLMDVDSEIMIVTHFEDVTAQKIREKEKQNAHDQERKRIETLEEISRLKTRMLSAVSHEFRTPLSSIIGFTSTILETSDLDPNSIKKYLHIVLQQGNRLAALVDEMLDLSLLESQTMLLRIKEININETIQEVIDQLNESAEKKNISVNFRSAESVRAIRGDKNRIQQVVNNVLDNAIRYSTPSHSINIETSFSSTGVKIIVDDEGMGITEDEIDRVFEAFFRSTHINEGIPGTGLGLTISKEIINAHNGTINIQSTLGVGTHVEIFLPYSINP